MPQSRVSQSIFTIGVDLGGTNLRIGAYTPEHGLLDTIQLRTRLKDGPQAVAADMCTAIQQLQKNYEGAFKLGGIGIGSPGPLELPAGILRKPPNLPGWDGFPLRATVEKTLGFGVTVQKDANAAALAEYRLGSGKRLGVDSLCVLTLGTGVGGGMILRGKVWDGMNGMGGEVGHLNIWTEGGMACGCGSYGCLEPHASASGVRRRAEELIAQGNAPGLAELRASLPDYEAREVADLAMKGDADARAIFEKVGRSLGIGLASLVNALNLPLYAITGGLANAWDLFSAPLFEELRKRSYIYRLNEERTNIVKAELGPDAGLLGASLLPLQPSI
jgi:glucokinase